MRRTYTVPVVQLRGYPHPAPERTAWRMHRGPMDFDVDCQIFTNRPAMLKSCEISERSAELGHGFWRPLQKEETK